MFFIDIFIQSSYIRKMVFSNAVYMFVILHSCYNINNETYSISCNKRLYTEEETEPAFMNRAALDGKL